MIKSEERKHAQKEFSRILMRWNREKNNRQMPWKGEKDPYKIWLSEIILQQTRVEQGLHYYQRFIENFPTVRELAQAPESVVFKLWEGLGYYTRCRNLIATARFISEELDGSFPSNYASIKNLKGIGPYTAAAISSFAFNLPYAVVDGNVFRVLSRVFGVDTAIDSTEGKKYFTQLANALLDKKQPGLYNQAIMDFGATVCKPAGPICHDCVLSKTCFAFLYNKIKDLPVKEKKIKSKKRFFYYLVMEYGTKTAIRQRTDKDIWSQLHEFPMFETKNVQTEEFIIKELEKSGPIAKNYTVVSISPGYKQQLSHQLIEACFIHIKLKKPVEGDWKWVTKQQMHLLAFPKLINQFLQMD